MFPKKIAIYSNAWDTNAGGGIVYILAIANILKENGNNVTVFFKKSINLTELHRRYETKNLNIVTIKKNRIPLYSQLVFALKEWMNFDIVIQQSLASPRITFVKKSFVLCDFPMKKVVSFIEKLRFWFWKNIIVNSEFTKYWVKNNWKREAIVTYPPIEKRYNLNEEKNKDLVCIGRFNKGKRSKRQDLVIEVFKELIDRGFSSINLHLIGFVQDEEYIKKLKILSEGYPIYFYEICSIEKRNEILNNSTIFISACGYKINEREEPQYTEHYGISVVEAMAFGCIPIVIGKGGHKETVDHLKNGYHWETRKELLKYITMIIDDTQLRNELAKQAFMKSEQFSFTNLEKKLLEILKL